MPTETRVITFSNAEVVEAIANYCLKTGRLTPSASASGLTFTNDGGISASFEPVPPGPTMTVQLGEITAALLLYCKQHGIPIAQRSIKSLEVAQDVVFLRLTMP
jgi:hypothetical protein